MPKSSSELCEPGRLTAIHNRLNDLENRINEESNRPLSSSELTQMKKERLFWKDQIPS